LAVINYVVNDNSALLSLRYVGIILEESKNIQITQYGGKTVVSLSTSDFVSLNQYSYENLKNSEPNTKLQMSCKLILKIKSQ
jgi:hypothetical protein